MAIKESNVKALMSSLGSANNTRTINAVKASQGVTKQSGKGLYHKLREYFQGDCFEAELDKYIEFAEYFSKTKERSFDNLDKDDRLKAKLNYAQRCSKNITQKLNAYSGSSGVFYGHGELATAAGMAEGLLVMVAAETLVVIDVRGSDPVILEVRPVNKSVSV